MDKTGDTKISVASECRRELIEQMPKTECCRRALLGGLLFCARLLDDGQIAVLYKEEAAAGTAARLLRQFFSVKVEPETVRRGAHRFWGLVFTSRRAAEQLADVTAKGILPMGDSPCAACASAFLRGVFVACGTLTDPEKGCHLEFCIPQGKGAEAVEALLEDMDVPPKRACRKNGTGLYYKGSGAVEELLAALGASTTVFSLINAKILREIRNHENRVANCDTGNIQKSVSATRRQLEAIAVLREHGRMDRLDDELRRTAELREENPELSLGELGLRMSPPISKPGMYHRMNKIIALAEVVAAEAERKE